MSHGTSLFRLRLPALLRTLRPARVSGGYDAFISYSRNDDGAFARTLQGGLQGFAKPWYRLRALRVFRDDASMSAEAGLRSAIEHALDSSRFLILLASRAAAASPWVDREVEYWCRDPERRSRLRIALTDGEIVWNPTSNDFDWERTTAFPPCLRGILPEEPRYVDATWTRAAESLSMSQPLLREAVADLAAPLHGIPKDALDSEDVRQHRRTIRLVRGIVLTLVGLTAAAVYFGVDAQQQKSRVERQLKVAQSKQIAATAVTDFRENRLDQGLLLALEAYEIFPSVDAREARDALARGAEATSAVVGFLHGSQGPVGSLGIGGNGATLASSGADGRILVWDVAGLRRTRTLRAGKPGVGSVAVSPDGRTLAYATSNPPAGSTVTVFTLVGAAKANPIDLGTLHTSVTALAFSPDGSRLVAATEGDGLLLWRLPPGGKPTLARRWFSSARERRTLTSVAFVGSAAIAAGDVRGSVHLVHLDGSPSIEIPGGSTVEALAADADGRWLATAGNRGLSLVRRSGSSWRYVETPALPASSSLAGSPDSTMIAVGTANGAIELVDATRTPGKRVGTLSGHHGAVNELVFGAAGRTLVSAGADGKIIVWAVPGHERSRILTRHEGSVRAVAFSPDGRLLASAGDEATIVLWPSQTVLRTLDPITSLSFSPGGASLAAGTSGLAGEPAVQLWDVPKRKLSATLPAAGLGSVETVSFSPDGTELAWGGRGGLVIWDVDHEKVLHRLRQNEYAPVRSAAFSPDGRMLAAAAGSTVTVWDAAKGRVVGEPLRETADRVIRRLAFSPDGRMLAWGEDDGKVVLCPLDCDESGERTLERGGAIYALAFGPDGSTIVSGDAAGRVVMADTATTTTIGSRLQLDEAVVDVAVAPDGSRLAVASGNDVRVIRPLPLGTGSETIDAIRREFCEMAHRSLTRLEWAQFLPGEKYHATCGT